jgi:hypothetical protein
LRARAHPDLTRRPPLLPVGVLSVVAVHAFHTFLLVIVAAAIVVVIAIAACMVSSGVRSSVCDKCRGCHVAVCL